MREQPPIEPESAPDDQVTTLLAPVNPPVAAQASQTETTLPGIENYPGFISEAKVKRSRWLSRPAIGIAAGLIGLGVGVATGGDTQAAKDEAQKDAEAKIALIQGQTDELVDEARQDALEEQQQAVDDAVAAAVAEEKARQSALIKKAVAEAVKDTKAELAASTKPKTLVSSTDPRFDTCGAANAAGYGNYRSGEDPEYEWYDDRDNDGVVCE
jgi:hypothetical protein